RADIMRGVELLHPELQAAAARFTAECKAAGLNALITETWRTAAEQDALYAQGRTAPGRIVTNCRGADYQSPHQWGVAFDFCRNVRGREYDDGDGFFSKCGAAGKRAGLFWGGDFKSFKDKPHLELPKFLPGNGTASLKRLYGAPEAFKASWDKPPGGVITETARRMPVLKRGARGCDVKTLQTALTRAGFIVAADGSFGAVTDKTLRLFQKARGLAADGSCGPATWKALGY
ncbi:MAG: peptidoglycan-binding protein, partial [Oscillospiraceae bacterium]|nr:peptidoglycan-binding protein [Oscillospiraceae bacterium]